MECVIRSLNGSKRLKKDIHGNTGCKKGSYTGSTKLRDTNAHAHAHAPALARARAHTQAHRHRHTHTHIKTMITAVFLPTG